MSKLRHKTMSKSLLTFSTLAITLLTNACSVEPWVKPYEKGNLADPIMLLDRDPVSSAYLGHVHDAREGARGAGTAAGGGCGCN